MALLSIINEKNDPLMAVLSDKQLETLKDLVKLTDEHLDLAEINYDTGTVHVSMTYNEGTPKQFTEHDFIVVNVGADSVPAIFKDVFTAVYDRVMY